MKTEAVSASGRSLGHITRKGIWGWMLFDWAAQPFHTLLMTFVFARYFAAEVAPDPATGQIWWGTMLAITGVSIAILSPILGAIADATGPRKPWVGMFSALSIAGFLLLWIAEPGISGGLAFWVLVAFGIGMVGIEFSAVFNNAIMPDLVSRETLGRLSGSAWALGYTGGIIALLLVLMTMTESSPGSGQTLLGISPILGLDAIERGGERAVGPFAALWMFVFLIPFFLYTPDTERRAKVVGAVRASLKELLDTIKSLPKNKSLFAYLGSSMFYRDALNGLFGFGGVYAGGVLGWEATQLGLFGLLTLITGIAGALYGGHLDDRGGPKRVISFSIIALIVVSILIVTTDRETFLLMPVEPQPGPFAPCDLLFYFCGAVIGAVGGSIQAASRTLMVDQAEGGNMTQAFGLYALSGKATSFLAPALVALFTGVVGKQILDLSDSAAQRLGISPLILLFLIGLVLLRWVREEKV